MSQRESNSYVEIKKKSCSKDSWNIRKSKRSVVKKTEKKSGKVRESEIFKSKLVQVFFRYKIQKFRKTTYWKLTSGDDVNLHVAFSPESMSKWVCRISSSHTDHLVITIIFTAWRLHVTLSCWISNASRSFHSNLLSSTFNVFTFVLSYQSIYISFFVVALNILFIFQKSEHTFFLIELFLKKNLLLLMFSDKLCCKIYEYSSEILTHNKRVE